MGNSCSRAKEERSSSISGGRGRSRGGSRGRNLNVAVFGASGNVGSRVVKMLASGMAAGGKVRAFTHNVLEARRSGLQALAGVSVLECRDWKDSDAIHNAVRGCEVAMIIPPLTETRTTDALAVVRACRDAEVGFVLVISAVVVRYPAQGKIHEEFGGIENALSYIGEDYCLVRIPFLMENFLHQSPSVRYEGVLRATCNLDTPFRPICADDVARMCVQILWNPSAHSGKQYDAHGGPLSLRAVLATMSAHLRRQISFESVGVSSEDATRIFPSTTLPNFQKKALVQLYRQIEKHPELFQIRTKKHVQQATSDFEGVTAKSPIPFQEWFIANLAAFTS